MSRPSGRRRQDRVHAVITGPPCCGVPWIRRYLAKHPMLAVPDPSSGFWDRTYGAHEGCRPEHWGQAFFGLGGRRNVECCESIASLPSSRIGVIAAHNPGIRFGVVVRDPVARSWDSLREFHARFGEELGLGSGLGWVDDVVHRRVPQGPDLLAEGDYVGLLRRLEHHVSDKRIYVFHYDELELMPAETLDWLATIVGHTGSMGWDTDLESTPGEVDSELPSEPPPRVKELLVDLHRRQVEEAESEFGAEFMGHWTR